VWICPETDAPGRFQPSGRFSLRKLTDYISKQRTAASQKHFLAGCSEATQLCFVLVYKNLSRPAFLRKKIQK
jgi:hypothetical protein